MPVMETSRLAVPSMRLYAMRLNPTACHPSLRSGSENQTTDSSQARNDRCASIQPQLVFLVTVQRRVVIAAVR